MYPHILAQFPSDEDMTLDLDISDEALQAKIEKVCVCMGGGGGGLWRGVRLG